MHRFAFAGFFLLALLSLVTETQAAGRPNILWITAEDMSSRPGCYGDDYADTPHLDALARQSSRYTQAYATAPVCSPARACLITGAYATSLGLQNLRSAFPLPDRFQGYAAALRQAGYYTSNNVKTDYNTSSEPRLLDANWDETSPTAHWRNRRPGQPFFSIFNLMETHQSRSSVWSFEQFEKEIGAQLPAARRHDPALAPVPPYYPDTPTVRRTLARCYDCISVMDERVGRLLQQLEEDGLAQQTIVCFYADHGDGLPRGKRVLYDSGLRAPLLIRFPRQFASLAQTPAPAGVDPGADPADAEAGLYLPARTVDRLVSFVDFPPTVLRLAGLQPPADMQGHNFLGPTADPPRTYVFGARDRVDEAYELSRSVRDRRYLYIRNFMPHLSLNQPEGYSDAADMRREIASLAQAGKLNAAQMTYAGPSKPREELYDCEQDPYQLHNLAGDKAHQETEHRLHKKLHQWMQQTHDAAFLPEAEVWSRLHNDTPYDLVRDPTRYPLPRLLQAADLVGLADAAPAQVVGLKHADAGVRYWSAMGLRFADAASQPMAITALGAALQDQHASVRLEAAASLAALGDVKPTLAVLRAGLQNNDLDTRLQAARTLQQLGGAALPLRNEMSLALAEARREEGKEPLQMYIRFSLEPALNLLPVRP
ncbi:sulfatase family protein [Lignipirellula cremea]|uniref:Choline-sulfatase n=1 Tax=Lignipirellula cremea TaxID=2528010 RepID=A0A518DNJ7_9BACT|nr:sulfatase [Lignipirellula cremea]QDU93414.1 Choline-sulfatase [Lignipirellula cremea]